MIKLEMLMVIQRSGIGLTVILLFRLTHLMCLKRHLVEFLAKSKK